jgi:hypothetical protein
MWTAMAPKVFAGLGSEAFHFQKELLNQGLLRKLCAVCKIARQDLSAQAQLIFASFQYAA